MVGNHRTIYNETLIYLSLNLNPFYAKKVNSFCKMNPLGFCILFTYYSHQKKQVQKVLAFFVVTKKSVLKGLEQKRKENSSHLLFLAVDRRILQSTKELILR